MDLSRMQRGEYVAVLGGIILLISIFMKWYESVSDLAEIGGERGLGTYSAWDVHSIIGPLLVLAAIAPIVLAWIIVRDHKLSWPRGQMTSVVAITSIGLMFYVGIVDRPGEPSGEIELEWGWYTAMLGAILMLVGSVMRQHESEMVRKPPGVL